MREECKNHLENQYYLKRDWIYILRFRDHENLVNYWVQYCIQSRGRNWLNFQFPLENEIVSNTENYWLLHINNCSVSKHFRVTSFVKIACLYINLMFLQILLVCCANCKRMLANTFFCAVSLVGVSTLFNYSKSSNFS